MDKGKAARAAALQEAMSPDGAKRAENDEEE